MSTRVSRSLTSSAVLRNAVRKQLRQDQRHARRDAVDGFATVSPGLAAEFTDLIRRAAAALEVEALRHARKRDHRWVTLDLELFVSGALGETTASQVARLGERWRPASARDATLCSVAGAQATFARIRQRRHRGRQAAARALSALRGSGAWDAGLDSALEVLRLAADRRSVR
jgi:hypothetical protein